MVKAMVIAEKGGYFLGRQTSLAAVEHEHVYNYALL